MNIHERLEQDFGNLEKGMGSFLDANPYSVCFHFRDLMKFHRSNEVSYQRVMPKGEFELFDYNTGVLWVSLRIYAERANKESPEQYATSVHIGCADDGDWHASSKYFDKKEDALALQELLLPVLAELTVLPKEAELNDILLPFGLYGAF